MEVDSGFGQCKGCHGYFKAVLETEPKPHWVYEPYNSTRELARRFSAISILIFLIGLVAIFFGLERRWLLFVAAFLIQMGTMLFLISQVIHIRANTEKNGGGQ